MNRIFHARVTPSQLIFLLLAATMAFWSFWEKLILVTVAFVLLLIIYIERLIHTTYTLTTDGKLVVSYGRFMRGKEMDLTEIAKVEPFRQRFTHGVLIHLKKGAYLSLQPIKETDFITEIEKRINK